MAHRGAHGEVVDGERREEGSRQYAGRDKEEQATAGARVGTAVSTD